ncbi:DNA-directed DNA polymerase [Tanacetum coccineum]
MSELKPIRMSMQLADMSIKYLVGVCENLLVKINRFIFLVDFVVLEMDEDELVPIILGRPFLAMARAVIYVHEGKLSLRVGSETITFNIVSFYLRQEEVDPLEWKAPENCLKPLIREPPKLELKELLENIKYAFLQGDDQLPVVISSTLSIHEKAKLLEFLRNHK